MRRNLRAADSVAEAVAQADLIEEAVLERPEVKKARYCETIEDAARPDAVIGSNTSTLPIGDLAAGLEHPERFLGMHFSNPAPFIPGVELIAHSGTDENVVEAVEALVPLTGKLTARVNDKAGFVLNRLQYVLLKEAINLVEEGVATPEDVDIIVRTTFGYRLAVLRARSPSPTWRAWTSTATASAPCKQHYGERLAAPKMLTELVSAGQYGVKQGGGFVTPAGDQAPLVAYRNTAYARLGQLLKELGPAPKEKRRMIKRSIQRRRLADRGRHAAHLGTRTPTVARSTTPNRRNGPSTCDWCARIGFTEVDPTDTWVRVGDLSPERLADFKSVLSDVGLTIPAISTSRRSVMDPEHGEEYLAYSHRLLDVAAELGVPLVSFGFFQELTAEQQHALWFWLADGLARRRGAGGAQSSRFVDPRAGRARSEQRPADHARNVRGHLRRHLRRRCAVPQGSWTRRLRPEPRYRQLHPAAPADRAGAGHARQGARRTPTTGT